FLNGLPAETWIEEARSLQAALTDKAIRNAIGKFPKELYNLHGEEIIRKIKARRDDLVKYAEQYYAFLAREVDVAASNKKEWFSIRPLENGDVSVTIAKITKSGDRSEPLYSRTFKRDETKEIRLYGLGDNDVFDLQNDNKSRITVRLIGGDGMDSVANTSGIKPLIYDVEGDVKITRDQRIADRTASDPIVNTYDRKSFRYPRLAPLIYGNFNNDDGLFIGGGFLWITHGFRKQPYKSQHLFLASYAPLTSSYNFKYDGRFTQVFGNWGIELDFDSKAPNYVNNFFGLGNETVFDREIDDAPGFDLERAVDYYRIRLQQVEIVAKLTRPVGEWGTIKFGPVFQHFEIEAPGTDERFIVSYAENQDEPLLEVPKSFAGITTEVELDHRDNKVYTTNGVMITYRSLFMEGLDANASDYTSHDASLAFYHTFRLPARVTFGLRAGGGFTTGNYELYQAQILDGKTELRGYRKTRFYGDSRFFTNTEVRIRLAKFKSYLFPASFGMHAFYDVGRVWYKDESGKDPSAADGSSSLWHNGIGGGLWFTPFNLTTIATELAHGEEGNMFYIRLGFFF
ncbi:MAG TPA: BamA/TamA family outer membrane protein, partial [Ohtaekwangia sp.]|nr:BamA/TamA family outer membrane protein [Ohtaekwangia sp.]